MAIIAYLEYNSPNALWNHMKSTILETSEWILSFSIKTETSSSITTPNILVKRTVYLTITNHKKKISSCHAYHSPWHKFMMSVEWVMPKPAKFSQLCSDVNDIKSFFTKLQRQQMDRLTRFKTNNICDSMLHTYRNSMIWAFLHKVHHPRICNLLYPATTNQTGAEWGTNYTRNCGSNQPVKMWKICMWTG